MPSVRCCLFLHLRPRLLSSVPDSNFYASRYFKSNKQIPGSTSFAYPHPISAVIGKTEPVVIRPQAATAGPVELSDLRLLPCCWSTSATLASLCAGSFPALLAFWVVVPHAGASGQTPSVRGVRTCTAVQASLSEACRVLLPLAVASFPLISPKSLEP